MNSDTVKALVLQYWRYDRGAHIVTLETQGDVAAVINRYLIETEVKISVADLRRDISKSCHCYMHHLAGISRVESGWGNLPQMVDRYLKYFRVRQYYFAVPEDIEEKATAIVEEMYPYAGILVAKLTPYTGFNDAYRWGVAELKKKAHLFPVERLSVKSMADMVKAQSATLVRLALKVGKTNA